MSTLLLMITAGCLGQDLPTEVQPRECVMPAVDTTGWQRVRDIDSIPGARLSVAEITYLVPPGFVRSGARSWTRDPSSFEWELVFENEPPPPVPDGFQPRGGCRGPGPLGTLSIDYGRVSGAVVDQAILAGSTVNLVPYRGNLYFTARSIGTIDLPMLERVLWSVTATRVGPGS